MKSYTRAMAPLQRVSTLRRKYARTAIIPYRLAYLVVVLWACAPAITLAQTPSPLQEWQYSTGVVLKKLFEPDVPEWQVVLGAGAEFEPLYDGARSYRTEAGPVINIRYRDIAFASVGEGLGVNLLRGVNYRAGVAIGYDLGRRVSDDSIHLHGLGDIARAPVIRLFGTYVISKHVPLVLRADLRRIVGGADGLIADLDVYMPLPGSSKKLVMFAGPSITFADHRYLQSAFGVNAAQALASGYPDYEAHAGANAVGLGFSATRFITERWIINANVAINRLLGSASRSPITQSSVQGVVALSVAYTR